MKKIPMAHGSIANPSPPILLDGLLAAANKGNADAHYALASTHRPTIPTMNPVLAATTGTTRSVNGRVLTGVEKEWADEYAAMQTRSEKYERHPACGRRT